MATRRIFIRKSAIEGGMFVKSTSFLDAHKHNPSAEIDNYGQVILSESTAVSIIDQNYGKIFHSNNCQ